MEVPRGLLFHCYDVDENGIVKSANCVIPTGQNLQNIEDDMAKLAGEITEKKLTKKQSLLSKCLYVLTTHVYPALHIY